MTEKTLGKILILGSGYRSTFLIIMNLSISICINLDKILCIYDQSYFLLGSNLNIVFVVGRECLDLLDS